MREEAPGLGGRWQKSAAAGKGGAGVREAAEGTAREAAEGLLDVAKGAAQSPGRIAAGLRSATLQVFSQALRVLPCLFCGGIQVSRAVPGWGWGRVLCGESRAGSLGVWKIEGR